MSRTGIKYYSMDPAHIRDTSIKLLFNEFGANGYWVWKCLLTEIYEDKGYYVSVSDEDWVVLFATDVCKLKVSLVDEIIKGCVRRGLFSKTVFDMFGVLTSRRVQENYLDATDRRKDAREMYLEYCLVDVGEFKNLKIVNISGENVNISLENVDSSKQRDKRKGNKRNERVFTPPFLPDVIAYFIEHGYSETSAVKAFNYYNSADWKDSKGSQVKNWKQKMQGVWFKDEHKIPGTVKPKLVT